MTTTFATIPEALAELSKGRMIILTDDEHREQEGDLIMDANQVTPEAINFMATHARGMICLTLSEKIVKRLQLPLMPVRNQSPNQPALTVSMEAASGVSTGVSTQDRAHTIKTAIDPHSGPDSISTPGHIFPILARSGGVLERPGHTEGSVDLVRLSGASEPAAVIAEVMNADGSMARPKDLHLFAERHNIKMASINDLIAYRLAHENVIEKISEADLPLNVDPHFQIQVYRHLYDYSEHIALVHKDYDPKSPCVVRVHSECATGDTFGSLLCDCGQQLQIALQEVARNHGVLIYLRQEGRGIGLGNKIKAYHLQQTQKMDTAEANHSLGFLADHRHYGISAQILKQLGVQTIRLLTNNPHKMEDLERFGIHVSERLPLEVPASSLNKAYLQTKRDKLGHLLNLSTKP